MESVETATFASAQLVRKTDLLLIYRIDGSEVRIPPLHVQRGTTATIVGVPGTLVIPKWFAKELGLDGDGRQPSAFPTTRR